MGMGANLVGLKEDYLLNTLPADIQQKFESKLNDKNAANANKQQATYLTVGKPTVSTSQINIQDHHSTPLPATGNKKDKIKLTNSLMGAVSLRDVSSITGGTKDDSNKSTNTSNPASNVSGGNNPEPLDAKKHKRKESTKILSEEQQLLLLDHINNAISQGSDYQKYFNAPSSKREYKYKAIINKLGTYGQAPIHVAATEGNDEIVDLLINKFKVDGNIFDTSGKTALLIASKYGRINVVELLLANSSIDSKLTSAHNQKTPIHYIAAFPIEDVKRIRKVIQTFVDKGVDINALTKKQKYTAFHISCISGNVNTVEILISFQVDIKKLDGQGNSGLIIAATQNNSVVVQYLLLNYPDHFNLAQLKSGIDDGTYANEVVEIYQNFDKIQKQHQTQQQQNVRNHLMSQLQQQHQQQLQSSNVVLRNISLPTVPTDYSKQQRVSGSLITMLQSAVQSNNDNHHESSSNTKHTSNNSSPSSSGSKITEHPIHFYLANRPKVGELVKFIKKEGSECLVSPNANQQISVHLATILGFHEIVSLLIEKYNVPLDKLDSFGYSCLLIAARNGDVKMMELLINFKANINIKLQNDNIIHLLASSDKRGLLKLF